MAVISRLAYWAHLRADPNQFIIHYKSGKVIASGAGVSYWFAPMSATMAMVPVEDCETTFVLSERSADFQEVAIQITLTFRVAEPMKAAGRVNFAISMVTAKWVDAPLEKLSSILSMRARDPARRFVRGAAIAEVVKRGPEVIRQELEPALKGDAELAAMGIAVVSVQIDHVSPTPELQRALEVPTREAVQQSADEAVFQRRALAVEKERAIKENELANEIELARRQEEMIKRKGSNSLLDAQNEAKTAAAKAQAEVERQRMAAEAYAVNAKARAQGDAEARKVTGEAEAGAQRQLAEAWKNAGSDVLVGLALKSMGDKLQSINHLNITPDLVGEGLRRLLSKQGEVSDNGASTGGGTGVSGSGGGAGGSKK